MFEAAAVESQRARSSETHLERWLINALSGDADAVHSFREMHRHEPPVTTTRSILRHLVHYQ